MKKLAIIFCLSVFFFGCSKPAAKTEDPAEIEKMRLEHKSTAQRELSDG